ncbi:MAG TPA: UDP-N-acetylmuramoyl-L-alanine--D-glutamate ligase [Streptosporangiaceae bacterium]|jgi:UDP-N-acetylmuramoylalanine--D-glutamate ligase|nr:UDP-N-acetylmuramoyl-L-alanine--D-glutamate ligase [Streptosporangiaceae bacterium]
MGEPGVTSARGWAGRLVCVAGLGVSGPPVARALAARGARVVAVDAADDQARRDRADELRGLGVTVLLGAADSVPAGTDLVVTSPGWRPDAPLLAAAVAAGIPVIGDVELAWRLRPVFPDGAAQAWLGVTGTNGKTTTVRMLAAMLAAAGLHSAAVGNVGTSAVEAVTRQPPYGVLAVELSSFQLHWSSSLRPVAATVLNLAADHIDWHGDLESYARDKGRIFAPGTIAVCNAEDKWSRRLVSQARALSRVIPFRLGPPGVGEFGVSGEDLVDRAFGPATVLAQVADVQPAAPHNVANALAAAALARAYGVEPGAVRAGLHAFQPEPHRITLVAEVGGVRYVDDSKATNPHAAAASLAACPSVVWVAGGMLRGAAADLDDLVRGAAGRLRGAVLLGRDRALVRQALARHAPDVPVVELASTDTGIMERVVTEAAALASPGDTVLLAPAAASLDMFPNYGKRGDAFAAAVRALAARAS